MNLTSDERDVVQYLKTWDQQFVSGKEICRRASGKKRYQEEPRWFFRILPLMIERGIIESDGTGHYRIKKDAKKDAKKKPKRWMSPHIAQILKESGNAHESSDDG